MGKKDKMLLKSKALATKTKVGYSGLNLDQKATAVREATGTTLSDLVRLFKTVLFKPVRHVSHFGLVVVVFIVLLTGIPGPEINSEKQKDTVDPFGAGAITVGSRAAGDKVTAVEAVAAIASTIETEMGEEAIEIADAQAAKTTLAVAGDAITKPAITTTSSSASGKATFEKYIVQDGDTLWTIARKFGITTDSIKWSNKISDADFVKPGNELLIPNITGVIYTVKSGDSIAGIASRFKADANMIESQNNLYGEELKAGMQIIIPDGQVDEPVSTPTTPTTPRTRVAGNSTSKVPTIVPTSAGPNRFPWGYCTWWVAHKRYIPWNGNAWQWYGNAQAYGRPVGKTPVVGAVMVTWESPIGHVAYVESVNGNTFTVSEMNYVGYGRSSTRTVTTTSVPLIGFIY